MLAFFVRIAYEMIPKYCTVCMAFSYLTTECRNIFKGHSKMHITRGLMPLFVKHTRIKWGPKITIELIQKPKPYLVRMG